MTARTAAPRAVAATTTIALAVVLSLKWFTPAAVVNPDSGDGSGILNLLTVQSPDVSGWSGLSPFSIAFLVVAALTTLAGRGVVAVAVCAIALAILLIDLLTLDDAVALRWPAYAGIALAADLLVCATWAWRASHLESPVA